MTTNSTITRGHDTIWSVMRALEHYHEMLQVELSMADTHTYAYHSLSIAAAEVRAVYAKLNTAIGGDFYLTA